MNRFLLLSAEAFSKQTNLLIPCARKARFAACYIVPIRNYSFVTVLELKTRTCIHNLKYGKYEVNIFVTYNGRYFKNTR